MDDLKVQAARVLMGDSLGFHIIFVLFGLTLPIVVSWFEWLAIRRNNEQLLRVAHLLAKVMTILVITGVISGTIIALQMSLVWPGILKFGGSVIGLPFLFETYAFLIEAVFLALYMYTWKNRRISQMTHWLFSLGIILGSTLSAYAITSINAWMNLPVGFDITDGRIANANVWQAMFSRTALIEFFHSMPGYYFAGSLTIAGCFAFTLLQPRTKNAELRATERSAMRHLLLFALAAFVVSGLTADLTGKYLAKYEPEKLAAIELVYETQNHVPLMVGGLPGENQTVTGPRILIPNVLSILAGNTPSATVQGLNAFEPQTRPPLWVHTIFDIKMTLITLLSIFGLVLLLAHFFKSKWLLSKLPLTLVGISGYLGIAVVELGWMMTEIGRQPWAVRGYVLTSDAITKTNDITSFGYFFPLTYLLLLVVTILAVVKVVHNHTLESKEVA